VASGGNSARCADQKNIRRRNMYRANPAKAATMILAILVAVGVQAASVHLKGGKNAEPAFFDGGLYLQATGALSGLGNEDVLITLTA
jgi:hypothetical protein